MKKDCVPQDKNPTYQGYGTKVIYALDDSGSYSDNFAPANPDLIQPGNGQGNVSLVPVLQSGAYNDAEGDAHAATLWQISDGSDFSYIVYNLETEQFLTDLPVPESMLETGTRYYWRVRYIDHRGGECAWYRVSQVGDSFSPSQDAYGRPGRGVFRIGYCERCSGTRRAGERPVEPRCMTPPAWGGKRDR